MTMDIEKQTTNVEHCVEDVVLMSHAHDLPSTVISEKDIEQATLHESVAQTKSRDSDKDQIEEPTCTQAAGPTACAVGQIGGDDFIEGGFEGWKVILGCALIAAPTVGKCYVNTLPLCSYAV